MTRCKMDMVQVSVHIRKNDTGEIRIYEDELWLTDGGLPDPYMWEDGSYACDCNRRLFFSRVKGEEEDWESPCSDTEYSVEIFVGDERIYSEFENSNPNLM